MSMGKHETYQTSSTEYYSSKASQFLNSHSSLFHNKNLRAIGAIGIAVGVVIRAQKRYLGSDAFVGRLNRLEMDYNRLISLFPQTIPKLKHYKAEEFSDLFAYLGNEEVVNLDPHDRVPPKMMNLVFSVGMCHGLTLFDAKQKNNPDVGK